MAWPQVRIVAGSAVFATGIVVAGGPLRSPLQLLPFHAGHVRHAVAVAEDRLVAVSDQGAVALIELPGGQAIAARDGKRTFDRVTLSRDGRFLLLLGSHELIVLEAATLRLVRTWGVLERHGLGWRALDPEASPPVPDDQVERLEPYGPITELPDGRLMVALYGCRPRRRYGYYRFDIPTGGVERHVVFDGPKDAEDATLGILDDVTLGAFMAFSPSGRYALRRHYGAIPMAMRPAARFQPSPWGGPVDLPSPGPHAGHPDVRADGVNRFGIVLELWDIGHEARLVDKVVVRMVEARHILSSVNVNEGISEQQLIEIAGQTDLRTSKPFEQRLRTACRPAAAAGAPWVWGATEESLRLAELQRQLAELRPDLDDPDNDMRPWHLKFRWRALPDTLADVAWDADETGFWVRFNPHVIRRVGVDGGLSPLVAFERFASPRDPLTSTHLQLVREDRTEHAFIPFSEVPDDPYNQVFRHYGDMAMDRTGRGHLRLVSESLGTVTWDPALLQGRPDQVVLAPRAADGFAPPGAPLPAPAFDGFLRNLAAVNQPVDHDTEAGAAAALGALTARFAAGVDALAFDGRIRIDFQVGDRVVAEKEFFGGLVDRNWQGAVPALRRLLMIYLEGIEGGEGCTPWHNGHAIRALVLLDPSQHDVYRAYLQKRDGEHDRYPAEELYQEFVARHGHRGEDDIRLGVFVTTNLIWGGVSSASEVWRNSGLFQQAKRLMGPDRFAQVLFEELNGFKPVEQQWDFQGGSYHLDAVTAALSRTDRFQYATAQALSRLAPRTRRGWLPFGR